MTEPFAPVLNSGAQLLPVLGNHDYGSGEQQQILTALGADASWYAAQVGSVRILVLDSNQVDDPEQMQWLRETLAGHDHDYQRSTPQDGVTYVVSGTGASTRRVGHRDVTAVSSPTLHDLDLLAYDDRLVGRAIDQDGNLLDSFTITR